MNEGSDQSRTTRASSGRASRRLGPNYTKLWSSSVVSNLGDGIDLAALPLIAAGLTRDPLVFSGVAIAGRLPWLLFTLPAGALIDRLDRKRVMGMVNLARFTLMGALGLAVLSDRMSIWLLYGVSFALGMAETLFDSAAQALVPSLVRRDQLEVANGRLYGAEVVANQFLGPPLGGALFAVLPALPVLLDASTFLLSALLILAISGTFAPARMEGGPRRPLRREIAEGLQWLWNHRLLRTLALLLGLLNGLATSVLAVFPLFAIEVLHLGPVGFGTLLTALGVGSILAGLIAPAITERIGRGQALIASILVFGLTSIVQGLSSSVVVVGVMAVLFGFCAVIWNVITVSLRQAIIPDELFGRVNSVHRFLGWGSMPLGALLGGLLADAVGLRAPFLLAGSVWLLALLAALPVINNRTVEAARSAAAG